MSDEELDFEEEEIADDVVDKQTQWYQYAVKVVCGNGEASGPVAPGRYYTAINVHNPDNCRTMTFRWKVTVALPGRPGSVSRFTDAKLGPDESLEIDCPEIRKLAQFDGHLLKGFVVLQSPEKLDVVAVYTASSGQSDEPVPTMHIERVESSHRFRPCRPLDITLDTGAARWRVKKIDAPGQHGFRHVVPVADPSRWAAPATATWVADSANATNPGRYQYLFDFNLSACFKAAQLSLNEIWADNKIVEVRFNGQVINLNGILDNNFNGPTAASGSNTTAFKPGKNILRITVLNDPKHGQSPTGISIHGRVFVEDGICD